MAFDVVPDRFAPVEVDEVGAIILRARDLLSDPARWCKGDLQNGDAFCIIGALGVRRDHHSSQLTGVMQAMPAIMRLATLTPRRHDTSGPYGAVTSFNDSPSTTHADVLALLTRAARSEEVK